MVNSKINKRCAFIFVVLLLIIPILSSASIEVNSEYKQSETIIAKVSGNFVDPPLKENVLFFRGHVRVPMEYDFEKIQNQFYISAQTIGKIPENYSIVIKNAKYMQNAEIIGKDITANFSITNETADFSVEPGFVIAQGPFFIEVQNLQDYSLTIASKTNEEDAGFFNFFGGGADENSVLLLSGETKKINFEFEEIMESSLKTIELSTENITYEVPVYLFVENKSLPKQKNFKFEPDSQNLSMSTEENKTFFVYLFNTGDETIENITLSFSDSLEPYLNLSLNKIDTIEKDKGFKIEMFFSSGEEEKIIQGEITAEINDSFFVSSEITLNFIKNYIPAEDNNVTISKNCIELNGSICKDNENCQNETIHAKDGNCCLGVCNQTSNNSSSTGKIIGWLILIVLVLLVFWFFKKKYTGVKKPVNLLDVAKGKK